MDKKRRDLPRNRHRRTYPIARRALGIRSEIKKKKRVHTYTPIDPSGRLLITARARRAFYNAEHRKLVDV